jgi:hypothetical protein
MKDAEELREIAAHFDALGKKSNGDFLREVANRHEILAGAYQSSSARYERELLDERDGLAAENDALRAEVERLRTDGASAVRWAPGSAYWSEVLVELFGPDARKGIDVLETRWRKELERADTAEALLRQALEALKEAKAVLSKKNTNET